MSHGCGIRVDEVRVFLLVPGVELENERAVGEEAIVDLSVRVIAEVLDAEERRVPTATRLDIANGDQRLRPNGDDPLGRRPRSPLRLGGSCHLLLHEWRAYSIRPAFSSSVLPA